MRGKWMKLLMESIKEAYRREIEANTIVINENMVDVKPFGVPVRSRRGDRIVCYQFPRMICGLNVVLTKDELPDGYSFAIFEEPNTDSDRLKAFNAIGMEPEELAKAAEIYRTIKEVMENG